MGWNAAWEMGLRPGAVAGQARVQGQECAGWRPWCGSPVGWLLSRELPWGTRASLLVSVCAHHGSLVQVCAYTLACK